MTTLRIALRYLLAPKSHKAVNIISIISMAGVAVATMATVVVLSVFNGFTDISQRHLSAIDPPLKVTADGAKAFGGADSLAAVLEALPEVDVAMPVIEERGLLAAGNAQMAVRFKGLDSSRAPRMLDFDALLLDGIYADRNGLPDSTVAVQLGVGPAVDLALRPSPYSAATLYVPRRLGRINPSNPSAAYRALPLAVSGVFRIDQPEYDNEYIFIPLSEARRLLDYTDHASAIEVLPAPGISIAAARRAIADTLGDGFIIAGRLEQQAETFRMIAVEKWVTFLMLAFILLVASFNIISTLSLLVIEKRDNMATLRALGATRADVARIFVAEGWLITAVGGLIGAILGIVLSLIQEYFGIISLAGDHTMMSITAYPVRLQWGDVAIVIAALALTGLIIGQISRIFTRKID